MSEEDTPPGSEEGAGLPIPVEVRSYEKTPMYSALHWQRYIRQALILEIERASGERGHKSKLICYVANLQAQVNRDDVVGFVDLLHNVPANTPIDLLLHTPGGDVDAAEKMIKLVRKRVGDDECLRVIIPDFAKSAGTMMALGANRIAMSDNSELGPIDPQVSLQDTSGQTINHSVLNYLRAFEEARRDLKEHPDDPVAQQTFGRFDPVLVKKVRGDPAPDQDIRRGSAQTTWDHVHDHRLRAHERGRAAVARPDDRLGARSGAWARGRIHGR